MDLFWNICLFLHGVAKQMFDVKAGLTKRFSNLGAEVRSKCESGLQEETLFNDKGEGPHDVWVLFELSESGFDIIDVHGNVLIKGGYLQVSNVYEKVGHDFLKCAIVPFAMFFGGHEFDGYGIHGWLFDCIENETILLPFFH